MLSQSEFHLHGADCVLANEAIQQSFEKGLIHDIFDTWLAPDLGAARRGVGGGAVVRGDSLDFG
jgi:hypothetical protein